MLTVFLISLVIVKDQIFCFFYRMFVGCDIAKMGIVNNVLTVNAKFLIQTNMFIFYENIVAEITEIIDFFWSVITTNYDRLTLLLKKPSLISVFLIKF